MKSKKLTVEQIARLEKAIELLSKAQSETMEVQCECEETNMEKQSTILHGCTVFGAIELCIEVLYTIKDEATTEEQLDVELQHEKVFRLAETAIGFNKIN